MGIDIADPGDSLLFPRERFRQHDLTKPLDLGRRFDLSIGLETVEELEAGESTEEYLDTLAHHSDLILFSAATPGQGGHLHINERPHFYWHAQLAMRGYTRLDVIRPVISGDLRVAEWYRKNLFLYARTENAKGGGIASSRTSVTSTIKFDQLSSTRGISCKPTSHRILALIPGMILARNHVEMIHLQSYILERLRLSLEDCELFTSLICDHISAELQNEIAAIGERFNYFEVLNDLKRWQWGIRNPTTRGIQLCREFNCTHLLRIIQDTFILEPNAFAADMLGVLDRQVIAGSIHSWQTSAHFRYCDEMGLERQNPLRYVHGALILAPRSLWEQFYLTLPNSVNHFFDDCLFTQAHLQSEGEIAGLSESTWKHLHGIDCEQCAKLKSGILA
ncbi:hypothetical protein GC207_13025 [bacterium]|nr:hypothetical protein [bacterium]